MSGEPRRPSALERFSATVEDYRRFRPGYPDALADWVLAVDPPGPSDVVLDVGCGTGIVTRLFADRSLRVVGLDPNREMLAAARQDAPTARYVCARAEALPIPPASVALAVCGQAFHWFETELAVAELARAVRPGGWSVAFWNERCPEGLAGEYDRILSAHSSEYVSIRRDDDTLGKYRDALEGCELRETRLPNQQTFDLDGFLGRARSASYFVHGVADKPALVRDLEEAFARSADGGAGGTGEFLYDTVALMWR